MHPPSTIPTAACSSGQTRQEKWKRIKRKQPLPHSLIIYNTVHPHRAGQAGEQWRGEHWRGRECCRGLLLDSMVISKEKRVRNKGKVYCHCLSGRALLSGTWGMTAMDKKKVFRQMGETVQSRQPLEVPYLSNWYTHFVLGPKSTLVHGQWLWNW